MRISILFMGCAHWGSLFFVNILIIFIQTRWLRSLHVLSDIKILVYIFKLGSTDVSMIIIKRRKLSSHERFWLHYFKLESVISLRKIVKTWGCFYYATPAEDFEYQIRVIRFFRDEPGVALTILHQLKIYTRLIRGMCSLHLTS